jgi:hypothetical protein
MYYVSAQLDVLIEASAYSGGIVLIPLPLVREVDPSVVPE